MGDPLTATDGISGRSQAIDRSPCWLRILSGASSAGQWRSAESRTSRPWSGSKDPNVRTLGATGGRQELPGRKNSGVGHRRPVARSSLQAPSSPSRTPDRLQVSTRQAAEFVVQASPTCLTWRKSGRWTKFVRVLQKQAILNLRDGHCWHRESGGYRTVSVHYRNPITCLPHPLEVAAQLIAKLTCFHLHPAKLDHRLG